MRGGRTQPEAVEQAALALNALIGRLEVVEPRQRVDINRKNSDRELLFYDWLNSVGYAMATRKMLFSRY